MNLSLFRRSSEPDAAVAARSRAAARSAVNGAQDYGALRSPPRPQDLVLSSVAREWVEGLPARARPTALAAQFPRIANRLALCWRDPALTLQVLDQFLVDRRGDRQGFPAAVREDLIALRDLADSLRLHAGIDGLEVEELEGGPWGDTTTKPAGL
jgi:hypothetical protein